MQMQNIRLLKDFVMKHPEHGFDDELLQIVSGQFSLELNGDHGVYHWHRVYKNALKLAEHYGVESRVFMLFALLHDSKRANEFTDSRHGHRGAKYAGLLKDNVSIVKELSKQEFALLEYACSSHTITDMSHSLADNLIVNICWDADRLDIGRVGFVVDAKYMCTDYAKKLANSKC